jgi:hypothetical protein
MVFLVSVSEKLMVVYLYLVDSSTSPSPHPTPKKKKQNKKTNGVGDDGGIDIFHLLFVDDTSIFLWGQPKSPSSFTLFVLMF